MLTARSRLPFREMLLMGLWPSAIKRFLYRLKGHRIGRKVRIGFGSVIVGDDVEIGDSVQISFGCAIRGKSIRIGAHVQIGALTFIDTPYVEIGQGSKFNEQVFVGGLQFPDSKFVVGRNCLIMQACYINPCRSIFIGDDSGVGVDCLLIGHSSWQSKLEGYPVAFEPIVIGNSVALAWRVTVLPGTKIGDGTTIGSNSLVKETIPPRCLAVGFPARVIAKSPYFPRVLKDEEKARYLREIVAELAGHLRGAGLNCEGNAEWTAMEVRRRRRSWLGTREDVWRCVVSYGGNSELRPEGLVGVDVLVSLPPLDQASRSKLLAQGTMWIDLEAKERPDAGNVMGEEVAHFLKRYGIRLFRVK